jgi:hypothetical protein
MGFNEDYVRAWLKTSKWWRSNFPHSLPEISILRYENKVELWYEGQSTPGDYKMFRSVTNIVERWVSNPATTSKTDVVRLILLEAKKPKGWYDTNLTPVTYSKGTLDDTSKADDIKQSIPSVASTTSGTGYAEDYTEAQLSGWKTREGREVCLYRVMCPAEYAGIVATGGKFSSIVEANDIKWFATKEAAVRQWALDFKDKEQVFVVVFLLEEALQFMWFAEYLDAIGDAYAADPALLNKIVRRLELL